MSDLYADSYFAIVPDWVLRGVQSDKALRLYTELSLRCDYENRECKIGRKKLAELLNCSVDTIDRLKKELETADALTIKKETNAKNVYIVHRLPVAARVRPPLAAADAAPLAAPSAAHVQTHDPETLSLLAADDESKRLPRDWNLKEVDGIPVTRGEATIAMEVMRLFNEVAETSFRSPEYYRGIVMRIREHPEMTTSDHMDVIRRVFRRPWWTGSTSPNLIYGNSRAFETSLNAKDDDRRDKLREYD